MKPSERRARALVWSWIAMCGCSFAVVCLGTWSVADAVGQWPTAMRQLLADEDAWRQELTALRGEVSAARTTFERDLAERYVPSSKGWWSQRTGTSWHTKRR